MQRAIFFLGSFHWAKRGRASDQLLLRKLLHIWNSASKCPSPFCSNPTVTVIIHIFLSAQAVMKETKMYEAMNRYFDAIDDVAL